MNKHIELVKKWLDDPTSMTEEELRANAELSDIASFAANTAYYASAASLSSDREDAIYFVERYEELTK